MQFHTHHYGTYCFSTQAVIKTKLHPKKIHSIYRQLKVSVAKVTKRIAGNQVEVVGTVQAVERAEISSKITGNIVTLQVDLGSKVKQR